MLRAIWVGVMFLTICSSLRVLDDPSTSIKRQFQTESGPVTLIVGKKRARDIKLDVPEPFQVTSEQLSVTKGGSESPPRQLPVQEVLIDDDDDDDDITTIEGVREPEDPSETKVYRNARIINNILITEEDSEQNVISEEKRTSADKEEEQSSFSSHREGRIMTGDDEPETSPSTSNAHGPYPEVQHYDPARSGLVSSHGSQKKVQKDDAKIVSYSYSTSSTKKVPHKSDKDVIYGSGFAANPRPTILHSSSHFKSPPQPVNFKPTIPETGFKPSASQNYRVVSPYSPPSAVKFQGPSVRAKKPSPISIPASQHQHNQQTWAFHNNQLLNNRRRTPLSPPPPYGSVPNRGQQTKSHHLNKIPSIHQAFGEAGALIHPGVIPASTHNMVIEKSTFQSHPGGPVFTIPVPRRVDGDRRHFHGDGHHQHHQFHNIPHHEVQYPYYHHQVVDRRPLIDKMMDPLKRVGERVRETVIEPVLFAGQRFGDNLRIPERMDKLASGTVDADAIPLVGGAVAVATLGALGAYAASKYSFNDLTRLLPTAATRSSNGNINSNPNVNDILLKLADDLENKDPSFLERFGSSTAWLKSECAQKVFCTLVTSSLREEEEKIDKKVTDLQLDEEGSGGGINSGNTGPNLPTQGRSFLEKEIDYIEKQLDSLVNAFRGRKNERENAALRTAANNVVDAVKQRNCAIFTCNT